MRYSRMIESNKNKRKTIVVLLLLILICITVIVALSFFLLKNEDDGKIGVNVTTGRCEVDIINKDGKSLVGGVLNFVTNDPSKAATFHPEYYYTEAFEIKNTGDITVEYLVSVSKDDSIDMEEFKRAFEIWITKDVSNLQSAEKLTSFSGKLGVAEKSEPFYLVVKMKESAGNEFQDKTYTGIGITVHVVESVS